MPIRNPTFSEAGSAPGIPRHWTLTSFVRAERLAGFGPAPERGIENFERWHTFRPTLEQAERAFFDARPEGFEDFSDGFGTDTYAWRFEDAANAPASFGSEPREAFERGFANDAFLVRWADVSAVVALFVGTLSERFDRGFRNDPFAWTLSQVLIAPARFGGRIAETFETTWPEHDAREGDLHG